MSLRSGVLPKGVNLVTPLSGGTLHSSPVSHACMKPPVVRLLGESCGHAVVRTEAVLSNSFGFGGTNGTLAFKKFER